MKRPATYRAEIARLRIAPAARNAAGTTRRRNVINRLIRELAAVLRGRKPGYWHEIPLTDACRETGEKPA